MPNTAQSDVVQPDTTREEAVDQQTLNEQMATGKAVIFGPAKKPSTAGVLWYWLPFRTWRLQ
ncbi:hypothetical protein [Spirosoma validum]|uniref:Uncharacterized protein n=1 Tax=Spirosoma validum TaxID=2771355 RepID=A0A927GED4_9BACT|nr:hypothetical protein [Spirosoma validum]MBD2754526.1 hypothetical protein [Spirosoma validum]